MGLLKDIAKPERKSIKMLPEPEPKKITVYQACNRNLMHEDGRVERQSRIITPGISLTMKRFPRNAPCSCGSGKKYKQCCYTGRQ